MLYASAMDDKFPSPPLRGEKFLHPRESPLAYIARFHAEGDELPASVHVFDYSIQVDLVDPYSRYSAIFENWATSGSVYE